MDEPPSRRRFLQGVGAGAAGLLAGCIDLSSDGGDGRVVTRSDSLHVSDDFATLRSNVVSGGVPKDGIPSIDSPAFVDAGTFDEKANDMDIVFGVRRNSSTKCYPRTILAHHEIVNDRLGDEAVSITYCPLTGTAMGFNRGTTTFGVSGRLLNNNLVMYDRATDSRWPQMLATAISGKYEGQSLQEFRVIWTTWKQWNEQYPETKVLSRDTGYLRDYDSGPYGSYNPRTQYYRYSAPPLRQPLRTSDQLEPKRTVLGLRTTDASYAVSKPYLRSEGAVSFTDSPIVIVYDESLDTGYAYRNEENQDVQSRDGTVRVDGVVYEPSNLPLPSVQLFDAMWFAWYGFYPDTVLRL